MQVKDIFILLINFFVRAIFGMIIIYFANVFLGIQGIELQVGMNFVTFFVSGSLGIPGVAMLYGITFFQLL